MIPDARCTRIFFARHFFLKRPAALAPLLLTFLFFSVLAGRAGSRPQSQDPNSALASAAKQTAPAQTRPSTEAQKDATPLKKAVHEKKVITEEDLAKPEKPLKFSEADEEENNPLCDLSCEAELKAEMGITPDREIEFRNQLTLARHEIGNDRVWNSNLQGALTAASLYCDLQRQKELILSKGDTSDYTRNAVNSRFAERERDLSSQYRNYSGLVTQQITAVQRFAPFRATIMQYQWNDSTHRACPDFKLP
jgi:hypothetical protein